MRPMAFFQNRDRQSRPSRLKWPISRDESGVTSGGMQRTWRTIRWSALAIPILAALYFGIGSLAVHHIDDRVDFTPPNPVAGGSHAINMAAALIEREVITHEWSVNDPWFTPDGLLDNTPNFQQGIMSAIGRFSFEVLDHLGRARGSSRADPDLERAAGFLQFPGDIWYFDFSKSIMPAIPSEDQYGAALKALVSYNQRLARGDAVFERRADTLAATIGRIAADLGSQTALLDAHMKDRSAYVFNTQADNVFYVNKGKLYAYYMLLRELGRDFNDMIQARGLQAVWNQSLESLRYASQLRPMMVMDGSGDDSIFANHLVLQGFYINRAVLQLNEIVKVLNV